jgi:hypothetical protein
MSRTAAGATILLVGVAVLVGSRWRARRFGSVGWSGGFAHVALTWPSVIVGVVLVLTGAAELWLAPI